MTGPVVGNPFKRDRVLEACLAVCKEIEAQWVVNEDQILAEYMISRKKYLIFGPIVTRTREEAIRYVKGLSIPGGSLEFSAVRWFRETQFEVAKTILESARAQFGDTTWLTREEFSQIARFYRSEEAE